QGAGEEAALEVPPRVQYVLRVHAGAVGAAALGTAAHLASRGVRRLQAITAVQHLVGDMRGEIELQAGRIGLEGAVGVDDARRLEEGPHHAADLTVVVAGEEGLPVEPAYLEAVALAEALQVVDR